MVVVVVWWWCGGGGGGLVVCYPPTDLLHASVHFVSEEDIQLAEEGLTVCLVLCLSTR